MDEVIKRLIKRQDNLPYCDGNYYSSYDECYSNWYSWGRWVFLAGVIVVFLILFGLCVFLALRRQRRGLQPYYGTGWMPFHPPPPNGGYQFQQYPPQPYGPQGNTQYYAPPTAPAPPYTPSPQTTGTHFPPTNPPPLESPQYGVTGVNQHDTGTTRESDYYAAPPGPPQAHVGKL